MRVERFTCKTLEIWIPWRKPSWFARSLPAEKEWNGYLVSSAEPPVNWKGKSRRENSAKIFTTESAAFVCDYPRCARGRKTFLLDCFLSAAARDFSRAVPVLSSETQNFFLEYHWPGNIRELKDAARAIVALGDESLAMGGLRSLLRRGDRSNGERVSLKEAAKAASREAEKELILQVLTRTRWNRRRAAQELQISYKALLYKLKQIGYQEYGA
jgi:hypothetical protein